MIYPRKTSPASKISTSNHPGNTNPLPPENLSMIRPPVNLTTMEEKRQWLEEAIPLPEDMRRSPAYQTLTDESKIILLLMLEKQREGNHASS